MEKLECFLTFPTNTNNSVQFSTDPFVLQRQVDNMCPEFLFNISFQDGKPRYFSSTCGGIVNRVSRKYYNFISSHVHYDNKGLIDNSTIIKMQLWMETGKPCNGLNSKTSNVENYRSWIIILSVLFWFIYIKKMS